MSLKAFPSISFDMAMPKLQICKDATKSNANAKVNANANGNINAPIYGSKKCKRRCQHIEPEAEIDIAMEIECFSAISSMQMMSLHVY